MVSERNPRGCAIAIVARDQSHNTLAVATASSNLAIGARCPYIAPGKAALTSQGFTNLRTGPIALDLMQHGLTTEEVLDVLRRHDRWIEYRQIAIISPEDGVSAFTGKEVRGWAGHNLDSDFVVLTNSMFDQRPLDAMTSVMLTSKSEPMATRLLAALEAGKDSLFEAQEVVSASLQVSSSTRAEELDLRVDRARGPDAKKPNAVLELRELFTAFEPTREMNLRQSEAPR